MPIVALPNNTVRAIGSTSVLKDAASIVKELVDNALDAQASSIAVEISPNTVDIIRVKDNGHGIAPEDRDVVCKASFTSKIRTIDDLRTVGGQTLGFRGIALASAAEASGSLVVTTRIEGEVVAVASKYGRDGSLSSSQKISHPVGTTLQIEDLFTNVPVRKQTALKSAPKSIACIKDILQSYAYARPNVRLSVKVLKKPADKGNWTYGPSPNAQLSDAAFSMMGQEMASQCFLKSAHCGSGTQADGSPNDSVSDAEAKHIYSVTAYLPRADADFSKISNGKQFISIDGRPLSNSRGTTKEVAKLFKGYIRSASHHKNEARPPIDPFLCLHLICPPGSYDVNVEPAKDDVLFEDSKMILEMVESLLRDVYGELETDHRTEISSKKPARLAMGERSGFDLLLARQPKATPIEDTLPSQRRSISRITSEIPGLEEHTLADGGVRADSESHRRDCDVNHEFSVAGVEKTSPSSFHPPSSVTTSAHTDMYGMDEEEPMLLAEADSQEPFDFSEDESPRDTRVTNPWSLAKLNATVRPRTIRPFAKSTAQLLTPGREQVEDHVSDSSTQAPDIRQPDLPSPLSTPSSQMYLEKPRFGMAHPNQDWCNRKDDSFHELTRESDAFLDSDRRRTNDMRLGKSRSPKQTSLLPTFQKASQFPFGSPVAHRQPLSNASSQQSDMQSIPDSCLAGFDNLPVSQPARNNMRKPFISPLKQLRKPGDAEAESRKTMIHHHLPKMSDIESSQDDYEAIMDFEHRKKAAIAARRAQMQQRSISSASQIDLREEDEPYPSPMSRSANSPHQNRYLAAKANLSSPMKTASQEGTSRTEDVETSNSKPSIPLNDPRAYLMRQQASHMASGPEAPQPGLKIGRTQSNKLPLETVPPNERLQNLYITTPIPEPSRLQPICDRISTADSYIATGTTSFASWSAYQKDLKIWEQRLVDIVKEKYRTTVAGTEVQPTLSLNLAVSFKEHVEMYGK